MKKHLIFILIIFVFYCSNLFAQETAPQQQTIPQTDKPANVDQSKSNPLETKKTHSFFVGALYNTANQIVCDSIVVTTSGGSGTGSATYSMDAAPGVTLGIKKLEEFGWGFIGSINYEMERNFKSVTLTVNGVTASGVYTSSNSVKLSLITIDGSAVYKWSSVYLPFGLNYSFPTMKVSSTTSGSSNVSGGLGAQVGIGFETNSNWSIEAIYKSIALTGKESSGGSTIDLGTGYIRGLNIIAKYSF